MSRALVLFTRDLRMHDNRALAAAASEHRDVIPLFVFDRDLLSRACAAANRVSFLLDCLRDLDASLRRVGGRLVVRHGDVVRETLGLAREHGVQAVHVSADAGPYGRRRRAALARGCAGSRMALREFAGASILAPGEATPAGGDHYRVFTPYWRVWRRSEPGPALRAPARLTLPPGVRAGRLPSAATLARGRPSHTLLPGGESEARAQLRRWVAGGLADYDSLRDDLACAATSRLSAHLHFGSISAADVLRAVQDRRGGESFARQLCWRDFHAQVLAARPDMARADYRPRGEPWRRDPTAAQAWRDGLTGYPIVDAGMRQLAVEGFMHNRARLIVGSFLTKTLQLDWRLGARHFAELLLDADVASNAGNWQWVAGTGNDTRRNRVLNPLRQAARFDPTGAYVRRWVPELADLDGRPVHEPWRLAPARRRSLGYPEPLVEHRLVAAELRARREQRRSPGTPS